jgi:hypothetical protein
MNLDYTDIRVNVVSELMNSRCLLLGFFVPGDHLELRNLPLEASFSLLFKFQGIDRGFRLAIAGATKPLRA